MTVQQFALDSVPSLPKGLSSPMKRSLLAAVIVVSCALPFAHPALAVEDAVAEIDRTIRKEPHYQSTPKYCLLTFGDSGMIKVWTVEDGKRLFIDKNANGDLTDDGPPIMPSKLERLDEKRWSFRYSLGAFTPAIRTRHTGFVLRRWNYNATEDSYGLSLSVDDRMPMYAGWFGTFWSAKPENAPVIHFGGPFTPKILRRKQFTLGEWGQRLSLCFVNPGSGEGATSLLSIDALPPDVVPELVIEWPTASGAAPLRTTHKLSKRCCYWEFYTTGFAPPEGATAGKAKITVNLPQSETPIDLATNELEVPVKAPLPGLLRFLP